MADAGGTRKGVDKAGGVLAQGSPNVFTNGAASVRLGDAVAPHGDRPHRSAKMVSGSSSVFINGKPAVRQKDKASCGHRATGSNNVFIGNIPGVRVLATQKYVPITTEDGQQLIEQS